MNFSFISDIEVLSLCVALEKLAPAQDIYFQCLSAAIYGIKVIISFDVLFKKQLSLNVNPQTIEVITEKFPQKSSEGVKYYEENKEKIETVLMNILPKDLNRKLNELNNVTFSFLNYYKYGARFANEIVEENKEFPDYYNRIPMEFPHDSSVFANNIGRPSNNTSLFFLPSNKDSDPIRVLDPSCFPPRYQPPTNTENIANTIVPSGIHCERKDNKYLLDYYLHGQNIPSMTVLGQH